MDRNRLTSAVLFLAGVVVLGMALYPQDEPDPLSDPQAANANPESATSEEGQASNSETPTGDTSTPQTDSPNSALAQTAKQTLEPEQPTLQLQAPPEEFAPFFDDFNNTSQLTRLAKTVSNDGNNLLLAPSAHAAYSLNFSGFEFQVVIPHLKRRRFADLTLPGEYFVRFGGRPTSGSGVKHKYGTNVSLHNATGQLVLVGSREYVPSEEQTLTVQVSRDELRIYLQRDKDQKFLHADSAWRPQPGPCIKHEWPGMPDWSALGLIQENQSPSHVFHSFAIEEIAEFAGEAFYPPAGAVPSLAEAGLSLPVFNPRFSHIGFANRADGPNFAIDDPSLIAHHTLSPFGPPADRGETGLLRGSYMLATIWTPEDKAAWEDHCRQNSIDPEVGYIGDWHPQDDTGIGSLELGSPELRAWIKERVARRVASSPSYDFVFWDVCYPYKPAKYTQTEWQDLQGSLYREIWKDVLLPAGWFPMCNVGNGKTDRNRRICEWVPILYLDRQSGGGWQWHEWTVNHNPAYRQELLGDEWISVQDGWGGDKNCQSEDWKYGWLTQYYQRCATLGGWKERHFVAFGLNGDYKASGGSGRHEWSARHWVPAALFDVGQPTSSVEVVETGTREFAEDIWTWQFYKCEYEHATVYHFPNYVQKDGFDSPDFATAPPHTLNFPTPHDVLQFDGTWLTNQLSVDIPAGSGRIVRPTE